MKKKFKDLLLILLSFAIFFELFFIIFDKYYLQPKKIPDLLFQQINYLSKKVHHLRRKFKNAKDIEIACNVPGHYDSGMIAKVSLK